MGRDSKTDVAALAALAYIPFLLSAPGKVSADSKLALYVDPAGFMGRAGELWDPSVGAGTVPHQNLGYLFPTGPWFWLCETLSVPDWVAQRMWWGTLTFAALAGARWLFRTLGVGRSGALVGALVYGLSPYQLAFTARMSVLLLPWAGLPWLVGLTMRATRTRDWRAPAALALVLFSLGGINASSLLLVALGPAVWLVLEAVRGRDAAGRAVAAAGRIGLLAAGVSAWWLVGIRIQGAYGLPVLQLTENVRTVAEASTPGDVLRGLGNWFFYGRDRVGYSIDHAAAYASNPWVVAVTYAVPVVAIGAALWLRWAHRTFFALLVVVGTVVAVGAWPYDDPSPYGSLWKSFTSDTSLGLAFRNSPRAVPLLLLGIAGLLAAAVGALPRVRVRNVAAATLAVLVLAGLAPVARHGWLTEGMSRDEEVPGYWRAAAAWMDLAGDDTRVLEVPGTSFAAYEWGTTVDPLTPELIDRPYLAAEVLPSGTPGLVHLLSALDRRMQLGTFDGRSLPAIARLLGVGTVSLRADLERRGRFDAPPVEEVWAELIGAGVDGMAAPVGFGPPGGDGQVEGLSAVELFEVTDPRPIVRTAPAAGAVLISGDGEGIVDAAEAGLIDGRALVLPVTALDDQALDRALAGGAHVVLTDTHRKRIETWFYSLRDTRGPTERADATEPDPTGYDFRLEPFPGAPDGSRTMVEHIGGTVEATMAGGPERPAERAAMAVDGDPETAWKVGGPDPRGQALTLRPAEPVSADEVRLVQPATAPGERHVRSVAVAVNGGAPIEVTLGPESFSADGQRVAFPATDVTELVVRIVDTEPPAPSPATPGAVGLAEVRLGDLRVDEVVRLPTEVAERVGDRLTGHGLDIVLSRLRAGNEEPHIDRLVTLPDDREMRLTGTATALDVGVSTSGFQEGSCRDDLVAIDGEPVPVTERYEEDHWVFEACEPVSLAAGEHRITTGRTTSDGVLVDRLVLASGSDGRATRQAPRGDTTAAGTSVTVEDAGPSIRHMTVQTDGEPFWLVLGESHSDGWRLTVDGATVGANTMVDGYANGWLVEPDAAGTLSATLRWTPQRLVPAGWAISALAVLAAAVLLVRGRRTPPAVGIDDLVATPELPAPSALLRGRRGGATPALVAVAVTAIVMLLVSTPSAAAVAAGAALGLALVPASRIPLSLLAPLLLALSRPEMRPGLAWAAVGMLVADLVVRWSEPATEPGGGG